MKVFYCGICDKSLNHKSKNRHNKTKRHYFMKSYVTNNYNYNDIVWDDLKKSFMRILLVIIISLMNLKFICHVK